MYTTRVTNLQSGLQVCRPRTRRRRQASGRTVPKPAGSPPGHAAAGGPMRSRTLVSTIAAIGLLGTAGAALGDEHRSTFVRTAGSIVRQNLPDDVSGHRPGPAILYAKPPRAPQLENRGAWTARPILVAGAQSYRQ